MGPGPRIEIAPGNREAHEFPVHVTPGTNDQGYAEEWSPPVAGQYRLKLFFLGVRVDGRHHQLDPAVTSESFAIE